MKKIIITIKDSAEKDPFDPDNKKCTVNVKLEDSKSSTESEKVMASNVYHAINEKLKELSQIR